MNIQDKYNITILKQSSLKAMKWSVFAESLSRVVSPIVMLILARLLSPSEFGTVAVATIAVGLARIFQEFGFGKALIQTENNVEDYANNAFWLNVGIGVCIYIAIFFTAPFISLLFDSQETIGVLRVLCIQIVVESFFSMHNALLRRNMRFKALFFVRFSSSVIAGSVSVVMAILDMGVWSLVFGTLAGSLCQMMLYCKLSDWTPKLAFNFLILRQMIIFSRWVFLEAILVWLINWFDSVAIGHYLGVKDLGVYRVSLTLIAYAANIIFTPIVPVAFSLFSRLQSDLFELKKVYIKLNKIIASVAIPFGVGLAILAKPIALVVLGEKWTGAEIVIVFMSIKVGIGWLVGLNSTIYTAIGRPVLNVKLLIIVAVVSVPAYLYGAKYGLLVFCIVRLITSLMDDCINYFIAKITFDLSLKEFLRFLLLPLLGAAFMATIISFINSFTNIDNWFVLILSILIGALFYLACLMIINKEFVIKNYRYVLQIMR
jgi:O-antigen/teichoic acid export membrane protein